MDNNILGKRIETERNRLKLNQTQLAKKLQLSSGSSISQYESGARTPSDDIKLKMCELFNCTLDFLSGRTDIRNYTIPKDNIDLTGLDTDDIEKIQEYADLIKYKKNSNEKSS